MPRFLGLLSAASLAFCATAHAAAPLRGCPAIEKFGDGTISRPGVYAGHITFSEDRRVAVWSAQDPANGFLLTLYISYWRGAAWSEPEVLPFSGTYLDTDPTFAPDGGTLYFNSMRPTHPGEEKADFDLWMVRYSRRGWEKPVHLEGDVNSPSMELSSSFDRAGTLYFASNRDNDQWDIYRAERRWDGDFRPAEKVGGGVNTPDYWEYNPQISPDGRTLVFTSLSRPDSHGYGDLYASHARRGDFEPARNLGPCVNSGADDYSPTVLWDAGRLVYVRNFIEDPDWTPAFFTLDLQYLLRD
ncbi:hypothetical protein FGE12_16075 [Aggregicoccus sp. 17bor-14]|uniref:TolB family protein n=1 Tax=Myxococcaceae TaxID=31 RepID=UPI00129C5E30|nr:MULTISPECIES: PD40 domain-containing protein [Myxococcaceae]MBF5043919.1 PD40 domain-containing protein [Simulacricoccus sp. 17bor-14]MRI89670.1 hypothetical protein [Aggregicoccus sp. 17bor-14]